MFGSCCNELGDDSLLSYLEETQTAAVRKVATPQATPPRKLEASEAVKASPSSDSTHTPPTSKECQAAASSASPSPTGVDSDSKGNQKDESFAPVTLSGKKIINPPNNRPKFLRTGSTTSLSSGAPTLRAGQSDSNLSTATTPSKEDISLALSALDKAKAAVAKEKSSTEADNRGEADGFRSSVASGSRFRVLGLGFRV